MLPLRAYKSFITLDSNITEDNFINSENAEVLLKRDFSHDLMHWGLLFYFLHLFLLVGG